MLMSMCTYMCICMCINNGYDCTYTDVQIYVYIDVTEYAYDDYVAYVYKYAGTYAYDIKYYNDDVAVHEHTHMRTYDNVCEYDCQYINVYVN